MKNKELISKLSFVIQYIIENNDIYGDLDDDVHTDISSKIYDIAYDTDNK